MRPCVQAELLQGQGGKCSLEQGCLLALLLPCQEPGFQGKEMLGETAIGLTERMGRVEASLLQGPSCGEGDEWEQKDKVEVARMQTGLEGTWKQPSRAFRNEGALWGTESLRLIGG